MANQLFGFEFEYKGDSERNWLVLSREGLKYDKIIEFQVEMVSSSRVPGIISLEIREQNSEVKLYYCLHGLANLSNYLKRQKISKSEFIVILEGIITVILETKSYLLDEQSVLLNDKTVYINPDTKQVSLIYLPIAVQQNLTQSFKLYLIDLLVNAANIDTQDNFVQQLLNLLKVEDFTLGGFRHQLKNLIGPKVHLKPAPETGDRVAGIEHIKKSGIKKLTESNHPPEASGLERHLHPSPRNNLTPARLPKAEGITTRKKVLAVLALVSVLTAIGVNFKVSLVPLSATAAIYIVMVIFLLGFGTAAIYLLNLKKARSAQAEFSLDSVVAMQELVNRSKVEMENEPQGRVNIHQNNQLSAPVHSLVTAASDNFEDTCLLSAEIDETTLLGDNPGPYLKAVKTGDKLPLDKPALVIGRNKEICDIIINSRSVGRAHAEIKYLDGSYYLTDLDSRNGTYLNDERLISNKPHVLKQQDRVAFAEEEYIFNLK